MWLLETIGAHVNQVELFIGKETFDPIDFVLFYDLIIKVYNVEQSKKPKENEEDSLLEKDLTKAFEVFDLNDDGFISSDELESALWRLGLWDGGKDYRSMITVYDTNADGMLDFEEFQSMMLASTSRKLVL